MEHAKVNCEVVLHSNLLPWFIKAPFKLYKMFLQKKSWLIHPGELKWKLKITCLKRKIIFQTFTFGFHVNFQGCSILDISTQIHPSTYSWHMSPLLPPLRELQNALLPRPTVHHLVAMLIGQHSFDTPLKTNISCWKSDGWKSTFLRGWSLFSGYLKLQCVNVCCIFHVGLELTVIKPSLQSSDLRKIKGRN